MSNFDAKNDNAQSKVTRKLGNVERFNNEGFVDAKQLAARWGITPETVQRYRYDGDGPRYYIIGSVIRFAISDVLAFEKKCKRDPVVEVRRRILGYLGVGID